LRVGRVGPAEYREQASKAFRALQSWAAVSIACFVLV
jgi:hypothetical protein